jgi:hypothetical protein
MDLFWLGGFASVFLILLGMLMGSGLYTQHRKSWNDERAREVRERREERRHNDARRRREQRNFL